MFGGLVFDLGRKIDHQFSLIILPTIYFTSLVSLQHTYIVFKSARIYFKLKYVQVLENKIIRANTCTKYSRRLFYDYAKYSKYYRNNESIVVIGCFEKGRESLWATTGNFAFSSSSVVARSATYT